MNAPNTITDVTIHFFDVGCGNMTLIQLPDGKTILYDCNVTNENKSRVLGLLNRLLGAGRHLDIFVNSHRDADHMRGIELVHRDHPIVTVWDSGVEGTTTDTREYSTYMRIKNSVDSKEIARQVKWSFGSVVVRCLNSRDDSLSDANDQSIILKLEYNGKSVLLAGDASYLPWKTTILPFYGNAVRSSILLAPHHGSLSFFDDPSDSSNYYVAHMRTIDPAMTIVSVGPNPNKLPDEKALELYAKYSSGSNLGNKVFVTNDRGTIRLRLKATGTWSLSPHIV